MLQTHAERLVELAHNVERRVGILDVVVRQLLAVELAGEGERVVRLAALTVELGRLVGVLAVAQRLHEVEFEEELLIEPRLRTHVGRDHGVVLRRVGIGLGREAQARFALGGAVRTQLGHDARIVRGVAHHRDVGPVFRRTAQHRRTADVDVLDGLLHLHSGFGDGLAERVEVHAHQVDVRDAVVAQRLHVGRIVAAGQQAAVHRGVQRLHAAVANLRKSGDVADVQCLHAAVAQKFHRTARGDHLPAEAPQLAGEVHYARLVADAYQCSHIQYVLFFF